MRGRFLVVLPLLLSFCGGSGERTEGKEKYATVLARAGESVLTLAQLDEMVPADYRDSYSVEEKKELVKRWIETELIYQEAVRRGIDREPEIGSKVAAFQRLLLENELLERELSAKIEITGDDIETFYRENPDLFVREKDEVGLSQIVVESLELATALRESLESEPEIFGELADEHSQDRTSKAGEVGYYVIDELIQPLGDAARNLGVGEISPVVSVPGYGYFIIRVTDRKPAGTMKEFDGVKNEIKDMLLVSREEEARETWVNELMEKSDLEVNWHLLEKHYGE